MPATPSATPRPVFRAASLEFRALSPESPVPSPESRALSPESPAPSPESRALSPESPVPSPESRAPSPDTSRPTTVAIVGASSDRRKFGNRALRAFRALGYKVIAINPHEREVEGVQAYGSVLDVPGAIDMATVYVPPDIGVRLLSEFAQKEIAEIWINPGAESDELLEEAHRLQLKVIVACSILAIGQDPYAG